MEWANTNYNCENEKCETVSVFINLFTCRARSRRFSSDELHPLLYTPMNVNQEKTYLWEEFHTMSTLRWTWSAYLEMSIQLPGSIWELKRSHCIPKTWDGLVLQFSSNLLCFSAQLLVFLDLISPVSWPKLLLVQCAQAWRMGLFLRQGTLKTGTWSLAALLMIIICHWKILIFLDQVRCRNKSIV